MFFRRMTIAIAGAAALVIATLSPVAASQDSLFSPTTGTVSGLQLTNNYNAALAALASCNSGSSAPNNLASGPVEGQCWLDTSATPHTVRIYDGASWIAVFKIDTTNHLLLPQIGGGNATVASATTTDLCSRAESALTISGTTTITGFGPNCQPGEIKALTFSGALILTHNATSLILPTGANVTTAAGDTALALYLGGGNWRVIVYARASGQALSTSATFGGAVSFQGPISITLGTSTNNWAPAGFSGANRIRLTCSSAISVTGMAGGSDGRRIVIDNVGSNNCTLTANDSASTAANRFLFTGGYILTPGQSVDLIYDGSSSGWRSTAPVSANPISGGYRSLIVTNVATATVTAPGTPNKQMKIVADAITVESASGNAYRLSAVSVTPDVSASGANGLDSGSVANSTWYYSYVIYNPSGSGTIAGLWSVQTSCAAVTLPSGYTACARVGANKTDGSSNFFRVAQYGKRAQYVEATGTNTADLPLITSGAVGTFSSTNPALSAVSVSGVVPATASRISVIILGSYQGGTTSAALVAPNTSYGGTARGPTGTSNQGGWPFYGNAASAYSQFAEFALEGTTIGYAGNSNAAATCLGWEDNL